LAAELPFFRGPPEKCPKWIFGLLDFEEK